MLRRGRNFKVVQIDAAENVAGIGRGGLHLDGYRGVVMKPCSTRAEIGANRRLFAQAGDPFRNFADGPAPRAVAAGALSVKRCYCTPRRTEQESNLRAIFTAAPWAARKCFVDKDD